MARMTNAQLQAALDAANARIAELEERVETMDATIVKARVCYAELRSKLREQASASAQPQRLPYTDWMRALRTLQSETGVDSHPAADVLARHARGYE